MRPAYLDAPSQPRTGLVVAFGAIFAGSVAFGYLLGHAIDRVQQHYEQMRKALADGGWL